MSDAEQAWEEWATVPHGVMWSVDPEDQPEASFLAGFRAGQVAALQDAAKRFAGEPGKRTVAYWLRARAAELTPGSGT